MPHPLDLINEYLDQAKARLAADPIDFLAVAEDSVRMRKALRYALKSGLNKHDGVWKILKVPQQEEQE